MIDHVGLLVADIDRSKEFYRDALAPLGYSMIAEFGPVAGFGQGGKPDFWISPLSDGSAPNPVHVAIASPDRAGVDAFYEKAIAAGGRDNGAPGLRPQYHPNYYGAFVLDPSGHNIEAVCHQDQ